MKKWAGALLIDKAGKVILQKRDNNPNILNSGKITLFGGGAEEGETIEDCLKREINEETGIEIANYVFLGLYKKRQISHGDDCDCYVYIVRDINIDKIVVSEGQRYVSVSKGDNFSTTEYSLITQSILSDYFKKDL